MYLHYQHLTWHNKFMIFDMCVCVRFVDFFPFISSFCRSLSFALSFFAHETKLRQTAIKMAVSIKYTLIKSFKGFELRSLLGLLFILRVECECIQFAILKFHMFELLRRKSKLK